MTTPRALLVDPDNALHYHLVSRCVRRARLCGWDRVSRKDYSHRKRHLEARLFRLARCFAVELFGYAIMSNHFHLVVRYDPNERQRWSDDEVAQRWCAAFAPDEVLQNPHKRVALCAQLVADPQRLEEMRHRLGSLSAFMQHLKQPISRQANLEDGVTGHFFEQRFYSGALLSERSLLAAMAYVDLNPVRARLAKDITTTKHTAIVKRLQENSLPRLKALLGPLVSGITSRDDNATLSVTLGEYLELLRALVPLQPATSGNHKKKQKKRRNTRAPPSPGVKRWADHVAAMGKRQRAYGPKELLEPWLAKRRMRPLEVPSE